MIHSDSAPLVTLDGEALTVGQAFSYLRIFGQLQPFIRDLLNYHVLYKEMQADPNLVITTNELGQTILDFRVRENLTDPDKFGTWLSNQGLDYTTFESQVVVGLKLERLKQRILEARLPDYFEAHRQEFDQVQITYVVAATEELAHDIKGRLDAGTGFEQIGQEHPLDAEQTVVVKRELLRRQQLREEIKGAISAGANPGEIIGPVAMGQRWCVFRLEQVVPAELNDALRQELKTVFFNQWVAEKIAQLQVGNPADNQPGSNPTVVNSTPAERAEELAIQ